VNTPQYRIERDFLGELEVPADAYFGIDTYRAYKNFQISSYRFPRIFIKALGIIKLSAARANFKLGLLEEKIFKAIEKASQEVIEGKFDDQFIVDVFQTGSGTSTNMNANEVIASRANEILGGKRGDKKPVHPNDHVNKSQSSNDVIPSTIYLSATMLTMEKLIPSVDQLYKTLIQKSEEFKDIVRAGRTHLQDALPVTLGQNFSAYATMILHAKEEIEKSLERLKELPLGGTAVGTGLNAHPEFEKLAIDEIRKITGIDFKEAKNKFEIMQTLNGTLALHSAIKSLAASLMKISNDLRLLNSGPKTGLAELDLPALQPGSSIMPGKVNPVIPEAVNMVSARIFGNDVTITISVQAPLLELSTMMPIIGYTLLESIEIASNSCKNLADKCITGIKPNVKRMKEYAESTTMVITAIAPKIGYDNAALIAKKALETGKTIRELLIEEKIVSEKDVDKVLDIKK
jgi:Fumarase